MFDANLILGDVIVKTTDNRGFTPEELADQAIDKIIYVGSQTHPAIRDQAEAFKQQIKLVITAYMHRAIQSNNTTIANRLTQAGHPELISILK